MQGLPLKRSEIIAEKPFTGLMPVAAESLLHALPHPLLVVQSDNRIHYANFAAEVFFGISETVLRRRKIEELVAFSSPLLALIAQVRHSNATVNEYSVDLGLIESASQRSVDVYAAPLTENEGQIIVMLQQRSMAQMIERQLTHRGAARSVSGLAAVLAHEIKNPLSGIRGAAQLLEAGAPSEDRPLAQLICRSVRRRTASEVRAGQHTHSARSRAPARDERLCAAHHHYAELRPLAAACAGSSRQADPGFPKPREERRRGHW